MVNPAKLEVAKEPAKAILATSFEVSVDRSSIACKYLYKYVLERGEYVANFRDAEGQYFTGTKLNLKEEQVIASCSGGVLHTGFANGGFYLPNDKTKPAKLFYLLKSMVSPPPTKDQIEIEKWRRTYNVHTRVGAALSDLFYEVEKENLWFPPNQPAEPSLRRMIEK